MITPTSMGRVIDRAIKEKKISSEKELNSFLREQFTQHNAEMDRVNRKLGDGIGVFLARADRLIQHGKYPEAIKVCDLVLDAYPICNEALLMKMTANISTNDYKSADACFERYKEIDPDNPEIYVLKWQLELEKVLKAGNITIDDLKSTIPFLDTAIKINPQYFDALISKAQILFWLGDDEYKKHIGKCRKVDAVRTKNFLAQHWIRDIPNCHPLAVLGNSVDKIEKLMSSGNYQQALDDINKIIALKMEQGLKEVLHSLKTEALICLKDYSQANLEITKLISLNKDYPKSYFHQAVIHFKCSELGEALEEINKCIAVAEKVSMKHFEYYRLKADILKKIGDGGWQEFERRAKEVNAENTKMFNKFCKEKGINPKEFHL
ncbi:MAG: hypothetical protein AABY26_00925 [Nanoarchaeota archaeon]